MDEEKRGFMVWVKAHKKELIIVGVSAGGIIAIILGIKNKDELMILWETIKATIKKPVEPVRKITVTASEIPVVPAVEVKELPEIDLVELSRGIKNPFEVRDHIRNLHPGWNASAEKIAEAEMQGIVLQPGQTLVDGYTKRYIAA